MKKYAFYGKGAYDLVYYLALLLRQMGKKVQVYDGTSSRYLCQGIFTHCTEGKSGSYAGIEFFVASGESVPDVMEQEMDEGECVFYMADEPERYLPNFHSFLVVGNLPEDLEETKENLSICQEEGFIILRDGIRSVIDEEIFETLYLPEWFAAENLCAIPFDWVDYQARIQLCYELPKAIPELSGGYQKVLFQLAAWITKQEERAIKKAYRKGRRGGK